jgi:hypothetical protein
MVLTWWPTTATQTIMFPPGELIEGGAAGRPLTRRIAGGCSRLVA